jgi:Fe-S cluster biogenesis protein NfuA
MFFAAGETGEAVTRPDGLREQVEEVLSRIRWALQEDGGDIEVVEVGDTVVKVRFLGACHG